MVIILIICFLHLHVLQCVSTVSLTADVLLCLQAYVCV